MTRNTIVQTDHKSDTQFMKYSYLKLINQTKQAINALSLYNHHPTRV